MHEEKGAAVGTLGMGTTGRGVGGQSTSVQDPATVAKQRFPEKVEPEPVETGLLGMRRLERLIGLRVGVLPTPTRTIGTRQITLACAPAPETLICNHPERHFKIPAGARHNIGPLLET